MVARLNRIDSTRPDDLIFIEDYCDRRQIIRWRGVHSAACFCHCFVPIVAAWLAALLLFISPLVPGSGLAYNQPMRPAEPRDNLHAVSMHGGILCVRCTNCEHRSALGPERLREVKASDMEPLSKLKLRCSQCRSRDVELLILINQVEVDAFLAAGTEAEMLRGQK